MDSHRFYLPSHQSPTYHNLSIHLSEQGWLSSLNPEPALLHTGHFNFNQAAAEQLEFKHLCANLLTTYQLDFMPKSYPVDDLTWPIILPNVIRERTPPWIIKPALLNNGQHIHIMTQTEQLVRHFNNSQRLGGPHVIQRYIPNPDVLRGHKYSMRLFVALTPTHAYLYPQGYLNVARRPYTPNDFTDLRPHLTNEHLSTDESNVYQIPTERWPVFRHLYPTIHHMLEQLIRALQLQHPQTFSTQAPATLALLGVDFMLDDAKKIWLLEVNHGPCFPTHAAHPLQRVLYHDFWQALIRDVIYPLLNLNRPAIHTTYAFSRLQIRS